MPGSLLSQYSLLNGGSVSLFWVTWYCSEVSRATASGSLRYVSVMSAPSLVMASAGCGPIRGPVASRRSSLFLCDFCPGDAHGRLGGFRGLRGRDPGDVAAPRHLPWLPGTRRSAG